MADTYIGESIGTSFHGADPVVEDLTKLSSDRPLPNLDANFKPTLEYKIMNGIAEVAGAIKNGVVATKDAATRLLNL